MRKIRFTIGGLMGVVLVLAISLAALRSPSETWAGVIFLFANGMIGLALLGVVFRKDADRAWWLGFFVFGWGSLHQLPTLRSWPHMPPTQALLEWLRTKMGVQPNPLFSDIAECLGALLAAILGGMLARAFFATRGVGFGSSQPVSHKAARPLWRPWLGPVVVGFAGLILIRSVVAIWWTSDADLWAGATYLLTWGVLGVAALGALFGRGRRREIWIGAMLFGMGYMYVVRTHWRSLRHAEVSFPYHVTDRFLNALRTLLPPVSRGTATANARVLKALERPIPMRFPNETSLEDLLKYLKQATALPNQPGIPIYVDPLGLREAERNLNSTVSIDIDGVPLRTTLDFCLRQLGLCYIVKDGCLRITSEDDELQPEGEDPFQIVGQCLLALIAAVLGGVLAPLVSVASRGWPERTEANDAAAPAPSR